MKRSVRGFCDFVCRRGARDHNVFGRFCDRPSRRRFSCFSSVLKHMLRWSPRFQVAAASLSLRPSDSVHRNCPPCCEVNPVGFPHYYFYHLPKIKVSVRLFPFTSVAILTSSSGLQISYCSYEKDDRAKVRNLTTK
jgi:hypothetical protein